LIFLGPVIVLIERPFWLALCFHITIFERHR
jgi:hypothetical protein